MENPVSKRTLKNETVQYLSFKQSVGLVMAAARHGAIVTLKLTRNDKNMATKLFFTTWKLTPRCKRNLRPHEKLVRDKTSTKTRSKRKKRSTPATEMFCYQRERHLASRPILNAYITMAE